MSWSASQYTKFEDERNRPIRDLLAQVPATAPAGSVADIGCGPGNSTEILQARFPHAVITAMDSSEDMIEAARKRLPQVQFALDDVARWRDPGPFDVILANAVLHWVPDHETLLPELLSRLSIGGSLAVQMPDNLDEPSHRLMREIAANGPWAATLARMPETNIVRHSAEWYYTVLRSRVTRLDIWRTTYYHPLAGGAAAITEWFKGSGLRPFLDPLVAAERVDFLARYQESIAQAYPALADGSVLLPFPRLFFVATR